MLGDGQELDMGEARLLDVSRQAAGDLPIAEELTVGAALPGTQVDLID